jgi:hypothetical protein
LQEDLPAIYKEPVASEAGNLQAWRNDEDGWMILGVRKDGNVSPQI